MYMKYFTKIYLSWWKIQVSTNFKRFKSPTMGYRKNVISKVLTMRTWGPESEFLPTTIVGHASSCSTVYVAWEDRRILEACCLASLTKSVSPNSGRNPLSKSKVGHSQERHWMSTLTFITHIQVTSACKHLTSHTLTNKLKINLQACFPTTMELQINKRSVREVLNVWRLRSIPLFNWYSKKNSKLKL